MTDVRYVGPLDGFDVSGVKGNVKSDSAYEVLQKTGSVLKQRQNSLRACGLYVWIVGLVDAQLRVLKGVMLLQSRLSTVTWVRRGAEVSARAAWSTRAVQQCQ